MVVNYTANEAAAAEAAAAVAAAGGTAVTKRFDVADAAAVDAAFKEIVAAEGGLHILVNNAGIAVNALVLGRQGRRLEARRSTSTSAARSIAAARRCAR